jgi:uncharacterized OsmC-like protein
MPTKNFMRDRQLPLLELYHREPAAAWVTDCAFTEHDLDDTLHSKVVVGPGKTQTWEVALHTAVGGLSDAPVSGDILCAALASCLDTTMRVVADRLGLTITRLRVGSTAEVDVRGTLRLDDDVPVAFQRMTLEVDLELAKGAPAGARQLLLAASEHSCVVLQTLNKAVPVDITMESEPRADEPEARTG